MSRLLGVQGANTDMSLYEGVVTFNKTVRIVNHSGMCIPTVCVAMNSACLDEVTLRWRPEILLPGRLRFTRLFHTEIFRF